MAFNQLTDDEDERLALLAEKAADVIRAVTKIQRHGYMSKHPTKPDALPNDQELEKALGGLKNAVRRMHDAGDVRHIRIDQHEKIADAHVGQYLHHQ